MMKQRYRALFGEINSYFLKIDKKIEIDLQKCSI